MSPRIWSIALAGIAGAMYLGTVTAGMGQSPRPRPAPRPPAAAVVEAPTADGVVMTKVTLADLGYASGFRFANLAGRRDVFVPLPQGADVRGLELDLSLDDVSAHDSRRSLEILANDRSLTSIALDGRSSARRIRVPLARLKPRDGFLKLSFLYSGAATQDRCIDVRYVGDSLTMRPDTAIGLAVEFAGGPDVATTVALMPREVAIVLPQRRLVAAEAATALAIARSLAATGRQTSFHLGYGLLPALAKRPDPRQWHRGLVVIGPLDEAAPHLDSPIATLAGPTDALGSVAAVRIAGLPALVVSDADAGRAGRLIGQTAVGATRGLVAAAVGGVATPGRQAGQLTFDQLRIVPAHADVFGRADLPVVIDTRALPADTRPARLMLDVMVAPDGSGEKAVVSAFVNDRLMASAVAANDEPTRLDIALPDGLIGSVADVRIVVQRRSAQGDCRFEPQGYPAQVLGSSVLVLQPARSPATDFSDLVTRWTDGVEVFLPVAVADAPLPTLRLVSRILDALSPPAAPINVRYLRIGERAAPAGAFLAVSDVPPGDAEPRVRFDRGRVAIVDRSGKVLLDLAGFSSGAVAQVANVGAHAGLWIRPLGEPGALPEPPPIGLDRGDVAFVDRAGIALALSTERDTLVRVAYPDHVSWLTIVDRFRSWIMGAIWLLASVGFLLVLQRILRRRPPQPTE